MIADESEAFLINWEWVDPESDLFSEIVPATIRSERANMAALAVTTFLTDLRGSGGRREAILVSCVGRKLALGQRIEEEVEGVREVLGEGPVLAGFYSYGEISPFVPSARCELHNQTMTITTLREL